MPHGVWTRRTIAALILHGRAQGQDVVNVLHFQATAVEEVALITDALAQTSANTLRDAWITNVLPTLLPFLRQEYTLTGVGAQVLERPGLISHRLAESIHVLSTANTGGDNAAAGTLPLSTALNCKWRSLVSSRHARGRTYLAPIGAFAVNADRQTLTSATITAIQAGTGFIGTMLATYSAPVVPVTWVHTIYNRPYDAPKGAYVKRIAGALTVVGDTRNYDGDANDVVSGFADPILRQQRRREQGVGS